MSQARTSVEKVLLTEKNQRGEVWRSSFHCGSCGAPNPQTAAFCSACGGQFLPGWTERVTRR